MTMNFTAAGNLPQMMAQGVPGGAAPAMPSARYILPNFEERTP